MYRNLTALYRRISSDICAHRERSDKNVSLLSFRRNRPTLSALFVFNVMHIGVVGGIAAGTFVCGAILSSVISVVIYSRWYVQFVFSCIKMPVHRNHELRLLVLRCVTFHHC